MRYFQFVGHQLISVLTMWLGQFLVPQQAVNKGKYAIHPIDCEKGEPRKIIGSKNQLADKEQDDKRYCHSTHITRKALCPLPEIEKAEHQDRDKAKQNEVGIDKRYNTLVDLEQGQQHNGSIAACNAVYPIHEVKYIYSTGAHKKHDGN